MFAEFLNRNEFYHKYMQLLATRMAIGNIEMENQAISGSISENYMDIYNNMEAFRQLLDSDAEKISPYDISSVATIINNGVYEGFRKTQVEVRKAQHFYPIPAREVLQKMYSLMDNYYNIWNILSVYEKEARFHIELVRTQPFEDGNKRTSRILTNYNLCRQNKAPIIISGRETDTYFSYIDNYDVDGFSKFLETKSKEELEVMMHLYEKICGDDFLGEKECAPNSLVYVYKQNFHSN